MSNSDIKFDSKEELMKKLDELDKKEAPERIPGAMCYSIMPSYENFEYICPKDGEKTIHTYEYFTSKYFMLDELKAKVKVLNKITNLLEFELDESLLCKKCTPNIDDDKRFVRLISKYPDGTNHIFKKVSTHDLDLLWYFFKGEDSFIDPSYETGTFESTRPLKDKIKHIKKLLGLNIFKDDKTK